MSRKKFIIEGQRGLKNTIKDLTVLNDLITEEEMVTVTDGTAYVPENQVVVKGLNVLPCKEGYKFSLALTIEKINQKMVENVLKRASVFRDYSKAHNLILGEHYSIDLVRRNVNKRHNVGIKRVINFIEELDTVVGLLDNPVITVRSNVSGTYLDITSDALRYSNADFNYRLSHRSARFVLSKIETRDKAEGLFTYVYKQLLNIDGKLIVLTLFVNGE